MNVTRKYKKIFETGSKSKKYLLIYNILIFLTTGAGYFFMFSFVAEIRQCN